MSNRSIFSLFYILVLFVGLSCVSPAQEPWSFIITGDSRSSNDGVNETIVAELAAQVVLIPHEIGLDRARDDRYLIELVGRLCDGRAPVYPMVGDYSAAEIKSVIGHVELLVSSRYHATIAALSQRIPAVVVGWAHKYDELMRDAGLSEYVLQCQTADNDSLLHLVSQAWQRRRSLVQVLEETVAPMERSADAVFDHTAAVLLEGYQ